MTAEQLRFRITIDYYNNTITLLDLIQNYLSTGSGMKGMFNVFDPDNIIVYQNTGWGSNDFSSPDTNNTTPTWSKQIAAPLDASTGLIKNGYYKIQYKVSVDGGTTYMQTEKILNFDYIRPKVNISLVADTNASTLAIADNTDYNIAHNGQNITPSVTYSQTLIAPANPLTGNPVVANVTSSQKTFSVGPDIYTRVYVDTIDNSVTYELEKWDSLVWAIVVDTILGSNFEDVKDDTCMCQYLKCITSLQLSMDIAQESNPIEYIKLRAAKDHINDYMGMYLWAVKCGQDSAYWCNKIKEVLVINTPCDCAQDDDTPHVIIPIFGSGGSGGGSASLFQFTFGTGDSGFPSSAHAGDVHMFTLTDTHNPNVYFKGDIYSYSGTSWTFRLNVMGAKGDPGKDASGVSAVTLHNDLTDNGTPAGTAPTVLKTYTLPAPSMVNNGDQLKVTGCYRLAKNANGKYVGLSWNGDTLADYYTDSLINDSNKNIRLDAEVNRINLISQSCKGGATRLGGFINSPEEITSSANLANPVVINAFATNDVASANDVICDQLCVMLLSMVNGAIIGAGNIAQGIVTLVANTPLDIVFPASFVSANYTISFNCYDSENNPQTVSFPSAYKTVNGFRAIAPVDCTLEYTCILQ